VEWGDDASNSYNFSLPVCRSEKANFYRRNAVAVSQLNADGQRIIAQELERCTLNDENAFYIVFPDDMDPDIIINWFSGFMESEINTVNDRNYLNEKGNIILTYFFAEGASVKWCNVFIFKLVCIQQ